MRSWIQRRRGHLKGTLVGVSMLLILTDYALSPPPDDLINVAAAQELRTTPQSAPPARILTRYHEFFAVTVVEFRAATSAQLTFLAYYTSQGRSPSGPPDRLHLGCVVHPEPGHRGQGEGARLIFSVAGQQLDMGELRFTSEPLAENYWLESVPRQAVLPLLEGTTLEGLCGGVPFQLSPEQWITFQAFVAGTATETAR